MYSLDHNFTVLFVAVQSNSMIYPEIMEKSKTIRPDLVSNILKLLTAVVLMTV